MAAWRVFQRDSPEQTPGVSKTQRDVDSEVKVSGGLDKRSPSVPDRGVNWSRESKLESVDKPSVQRGGPLSPDLPAVTFAGFSVLCSLSPHL